MQKCTNEHFNNADKDLFNNIGLNMTYCLPKNYSTQLMYNGTHERFGYIKLSYCKVEKGSQCIDLNN